MNQTKGRLIFGAAALVGLILAQLGSYWVENRLPIGIPHVIFPFLNFTHVRNLGGIFGVFQGQGYLFGAFSAIIIGVLVVYVLRSRTLIQVEYLCFGLITAGGTSNILDRLIYGSVIDFIDVRGIPYWNYIFNVADVLIHLGIWPLIIYQLFFAQDPSAIEEKAKAGSPPSGSA